MESLHLSGCLTEQEHCIRVTMLSVSTIMVDESRICEVPRVFAGQKIQKAWMAFSGCYVRHHNL